MKPALLSTAADLLLVTAERSPARTAVIDGDAELDYSALRSGAERVAARLRAGGVGRSDRVGLLLPRSATAVASFFGVWLAGAVAVPINERLKPAQVAQTLTDAEPRAVIVDTHLAHLLPAAEDGATRIRVDARQPVETQGAAASPERPTVIGRDLAVLLFTSGSTGRPKGIMVTHENLVWGAMLVAEYLDLTAADRLITSLPLSFDYGLNQVTAAARVGASVVIDRSTHPAALCRTIERHGVTGMAGVPFLWQQMAARHSPFFARDLPTLRYVTNSGGAMDPRVVAMLRERKRALRLFLMYGLTEAFRSTYLDPAEIDRRPGSIGKAIPNTEILVLDDEGHRCGPFETGELVHRGPTVAAGYWRDRPATDAVFRPMAMPDDGRIEVVVHSGDLVHADAEGFLYFDGRRDGLLKVRGVRVNLDEIEAALRVCERVADAIAFIAGPLAEHGEPTIEAAIVLDPPSPASSAGPLAEVERHVRENLPVHMRPARLHLAAEIPLTPHGKPDRHHAEEQWSTRD